MIEMYVLYQLARSPLQVLAKRLMCQGLTLATSGRHQCPGHVDVKSAED